MIFGKEFTKNMASNADLMVEVAGYCNKNNIKDKDILLCKIIDMNRVIKCYLLYKKENKNEN